MKGKIECTKFYKVEDTSRPWQEKELEEIEKLSAPEVSKIFIRFALELTEIPDLPPAVWPLVIKYGARLHLGLEEQITDIQRKSAAAACKKAADSRHEELRIFKMKASEIAKDEWAAGSKLRHNEMALVLKKERGFHMLPGRDPAKENTDPQRVLCQVLKETAKAIGRPDLIYGLK